MEQTAALRAPISSNVFKVTVASPAVPPAPLSAMSARMTGPRGAAMARRTASSGGVGCTIQLSPSATATSVTCLARRAARAGSLSVTTTHEKPAGSMSAKGKPPKAAMLMTPGSSSRRCTRSMMRFMGVSRVVTCVCKGVSRGGHSRAIVGRSSPRMMRTKICAASRARSYISTWG